MKKIVLYGPESTGKSFLSQRLASYYQTLWVPEFARNYLDYKKNYYDPFGRSGDQLCQPQDIPSIVFGQMALEEAIEAQANNILFCDTNPLQTKVYQEYYFQTEASWLNRIVEQRKYDLYLLTNIDIPWIEDGQRDRPFDRDNIFGLFKSALDFYKLPYYIISGDYVEREQSAIHTIDQWLKTQSEI
jgi:NadR type nicotinamide-nucleotide adenylyltransferase